jgi:hypothetical protein
MSRAELEKRILRLHKGGTGILKIGKALGIGTGTVQRVLMEQPRPFDVVEAAFALSETERTGRSALNFRQRYLAAQILEPALRPSRMFSSKFLMMNRRHFVQ